MWNWFSRLAPKHRTHRARRRDVRPHLEALEDRYCPSGGSLNWSDPTGSYTYMASAIQPDGKIVAVGWVTTSNHGDELAVTRLNPDDTPDKTFSGTGSEVLTAFARGHAVALQPDGKILVGGQAFGRSDEYAVTRLNSNGSLDTTFGKRGVWVLDRSSVPNAEEVDRLTVLTDPNNPSVVTGIIAAGKGVAADGLQGGIVAIKLTPNGALDTTFGSSGVFAFHIGTLLAPPGYGLAVTTSGEIFLASTAALPNPDGTTTHYGLLVDVNPTGHLNTAFNGTGYLLDDPGGTYTNFYAVAVQGNAIVVAGDLWLNGQGLVARYTLSGAVDPTFGTAGYYIMDPGAGNEVGFTDIQLEADGSIVVCGWTMSDLNGQVTAIVGHLSADGAVDTSFGSSGTGYVYLPNWGGSYWGVRISIGPDGEIVVNENGLIAEFSAP